MFERFTAAAIKVIMLAQEEARLIGHNFVGTEMILLGLIGEGEGAAALTLKHQGVTLKAARQEVEKIIGRGSGRVAVEIPFTPRAKRLLELSWDQSRQMGDNFISTEHLFMGLVEEGGGVAMRVLENLGVQLAQIHNQIEYLRKETAVPLREPFLMRTFARLVGRNSPADVLSKPAVEALQFAQNHSREIGHQVVGSEQLLLAILHDTSSLSARILAEHGVSFESASSKVNEIVQPGPGDLGLPLNNTPRTQRIVALAHSQADRLKDQETGVEHLLVGMLRENRGWGREVLNRSGVDCHRLMVGLLEKMSERG